MLRKYINENFYLLISRVLLLIFLSSFIIIKSISTDTYLYATENFISQSILALLFFFVFVTIYLNERYKSSGNLKSKKRILICTLLLFPTLNFHYEPHTDYENYNCTLGERFNGSSYITISPYFISSIKLFIGSKSKSYPSSKYSDPNFSISIDKPIKALPKSNMYFLCFISVIFNSILFVLIYRREKTLFNQFKV